MITEKRFVSKIGDAFIVRFQYSRETVKRRFGFWFDSVKTESTVIQHPTESDVFENLMEANSISNIWHLFTFIIIVFLEQHVFG